MAERRASQSDGAGGVYIALGTNLPFAGLSGPALLIRALERIEAAGVKVLARSGFWRSPPWPPELRGQPPFVNAAAAVDPGPLDPAGLLAALAATEAAFGRERRTRWAARTLDLDIIDFRGVTEATAALTLPHPRAAQRAFVLAPLMEIAPAWRHPVLGLTAGELLAALGEDPDLPAQEAVRLN
jgi:2-amino-4-hydroxy-6-hydroxymethyldihydropteridine diphosphokinase